MPNEFYSKGTIKVKNQDGILEPFHPKTDFSSVEDAEGTTLTQIISNISTQITAAENSGGIELMYDEPTSENTADFSNETMIAWIDYPDVWQYVVNTGIHIDKNGAGVPNNTTTAIPFNLYGQTGITLTVDWGDETTSTLTASDYTENDSTASEHTYAEKGIYTVRIKSSDWSNTYFSPYYYHHWSESEKNNKFNYIIYFRGTLVSVESPIPSIKGISYFATNNGSKTTYVNSLSYLFKFCVNLKEVVPTIFRNCTNIIDFEDCFSGCEKLQSIPTDLFKYNTNASSFSGCFSTGYALTSIPVDLFKYNTNAYDFSDCFNYCSKIAEIPTDLFKYNTAATNFSGCFKSCSSIKSIPTDLFKYNTAATNFSGCFESTAITAIPENIFQYNILAVDFSECFANCWSVPSIPENLFRNNVNATNFYWCFASFRGIATIPSNLFRYNTAATNFEDCFFLCGNLASVPSDLFRYNTVVTNFNGCFMECSSLNDIELHVGSMSVSSCTNFVTLKSGTTRTVYVPSGSTTEATFNVLASDLGLTIIGE